MSLQQVIFGILEFLVSIFISFILVFASYRLVLALTRVLDEERQLKQKNAAVGVVLGSILVGEAIIVRQAIYPVMAVIQLYVLGEQKNASSLLKMLGYSIGYVLLAGILAILCILFSFWLFDKLTPRLDQYAEIKSGNLAVALFMALMIIAVCLLISSGVSGLTRALIPFPQVGTLPIR